MSYGKRPLPLITQSKPAETLAELSKPGQACTDRRPDGSCGLPDRSRRAAQLNPQTETNPIIKRGIEIAHQNVEHPETITGRTSNGMCTADSPKGCNRFSRI